jgi:sugar (pentulose or hexulose) kinase
VDGVITGAGTGAVTGARDLFLGLDVGTTNVKAVVLDAAGALLSSGSAAVAVHLVGADGVEQDMGEIRGATASALAETVRGCGADAARIAAIGVSAQGGAMQLLARDGSPKGPVIGWQDGRSLPWARRLVARRSTRWFQRRVGAHAISGCPGQIERLRSEGSLGTDTGLGWVGDRIVGWLCGRPAHDATSLSICFLCNPSTGREDPDVLSLLGVTPDRLPDLIDVRERAGGLLPEVAKALGLPPGIPVGPAVHDQYAAAVGCGAVAAGDVMFGAGTAWVLLAMSDRMPRPVEPWSLIGRHPVPGLYGLMVSLGNGGSSFAWARDILGRKAAEEAELDRLISGVPMGSDGLRFRPLLSPVSGVALPPGTAGRLDGIRLHHTAAHVLRSVVEGLACELGWALKDMRSAGVHVSRLVMSGRAAGSTVTPGIVADVLGLPVDTVTQPETSAIGAAILGRSLAEPRSTLAGLAAAMKPAVRRIEPGPGREVGARLLKQYIERFRRGHTVAPDEQRAKRRRTS